MIGALLRGLVHDLRFPPTTSKGAAATGAPRKATLAAHFAGPVVTAAEGYTNDGIYSSLFGPCLVLLAWLHAFVGPIAGVQDLGSSNMYGNLRMLGGSNHLLVPTNVLRVSGEIVRVESSTSSVINALYPGEISSVITPRAVSYTHLTLPTICSV